MKTDIQIFFRKFSLSNFLHFSPLFYYLSSSPYQLNLLLVLLM